ncbi:DUF3810 domain-containing protein [Paraflavitalea pollutisoli]|uniref:DUF3810 domain-containing protein n=1 Tax=Paraflavitalea pollutisoli TaxID=3034143 RepID=UPI0023ED8D2C|nr:DUF3810 domain-containing protein [Paraflavitalea sp. H1-2-19X]
MWKKNKWLFLLIGVALLLKVFSMFPEAVDRYYAHGFYPLMAAVQRILLGWIPFSIGDLLYGAAIIFLLYKLFDLVKRLIRRKADRTYWLSGGRLLLHVILCVYVSFNLFWGLNYNRAGIAADLGLQVDKYTKEELVQVMEVLVSRLQDLDSTGRIDREALHKKRYLFDGAEVAYDSLTPRHPAISYRHSSVKPSLYSYLGNYLGYTGYYNPFTGEAQVNTTVPVFLQPFTTCHEIGHQLGYAKESEANFSGYLAAKSSSDARFRYSVYFDMYSYSWYYLYRQDSMLAKQFREHLPQGAKKDYAELKEFYLRHRNPVEAVIDKLYGQYLKANQQPSGKLSYNEVIAWLIAYYRKYGAGAV